MIFLHRLVYRLTGWPRWVLVAILILAAAGSAVVSRPASRATATASRPVVVAVRPLPVAHTLRAADLGTVRWPVGLVPAGTATAPAEVVGRVLSGALGAGEAVTATRLRGAGVTTGLPAGSVAASVVLRGVAVFVRTGDRVDLLRSPPDDAGGDGGVSGSAAVVVSDVPVLAMQVSDGVTSLLVGVNSRQALALAQESGSIVATLRGPN